MVKLKYLLQDPIMLVYALGFAVPFILQAGLFPFQKLSMFSEDPKAYVRFSKRLPK